jgi:hypothetical protein
VYFQRKKSDRLPVEQPGLDLGQRFVRRPRVALDPRIRLGGILRFGFDSDEIAVLDALAPERLADRRQVIGVLQRHERIGRKLAVVHALGDDDFSGEVHALGSDPAYFGMLSVVKLRGRLGDDGLAPFIFHLFLK